jgi:hypothetical protein
MRPTVTDVSARTASGASTGSMPRGEMRPTVTEDQTARNLDSDMGEE